MTRIACLGILRRAEERDKPLPPLLEWALRVQAGLLPFQPSALPASTAGFLAESSATAGSVGYEEEQAPTMKAGGKSGAVLCLNDQGGGRMDCSAEQSGTLRAQTHGHEPLVFANHGQSTRFSGPIRTATTVTAGYGEGGNNTPFVAQCAAWCITGNVIDREPENGGNGLGVNEELAFTLTATDHHAVFSRQRTDVFKPNDLASTESARQYKDATDLVVQQTVGALCGSDWRGIGNQYVEQDKCVVQGPHLIRRLTPVECERLQGFPDGWTELPGASDSARYRALGNSVAIPCVNRLMLGIAAVYRKGLRYELPE